MRVPCIKIVSKVFTPSGDELRSYDKDSVLSRVYRNEDGTFNVVKKAIAFSKPEDAVDFSNRYILGIDKKQVWAASADTIEHRNWMYNRNFIEDFFNESSCVDDDILLSFIESAGKAEAPDLTAFRIFLESREIDTGLPDLSFEAPRGTVLATNLVLHEQIHLPPYSKDSKEKAVKAITEKLDVLEL